jgi:SagB-type dehydrogenase family enzyme
LEQALQGRRSVREFLDETISLAELGQLLWAAQGITGLYDYKRAAPSAGGLCPLETYVLAGNVDGLARGLYKYQAKGHGLVIVSDRDVRFELGRAAVDQTWLADGAAVFLFAAVYERTTGKYRDRGFRYVHMDVAFAAENLHLQAAALGLGTVVMGAFDDDKVHQVVGLAPDERPLLIMPVGHKK